MENKISLGVVLGHGDYPFNQRTTKENSGFPVYLDKVQKQHNNIHMCEVMRGVVPSMKDGKVVDNLTFEGKNNTLSRQGFTIQQDVPYDPTKHSITIISQMDRLLLQVRR